jgi:hypothetical protein
VAERSDTERGGVPKTRTGRFAPELPVRRTLGPPAYGDNLFHFRTFNRYSGSAAPANQSVVDITFARKAGPSCRRIGRTRAGGTKASGRTHTCWENLRERSQRELTEGVLKGCEGGREPREQVPDPAAATASALPGRGLWESCVPVTPKRYENSVRRLGRHHLTHRSAFMIHRITSVPASKTPSEAQTPHPIPVIRVVAVTSPPGRPPQRLFWPPEPTRGRVRPPCIPKAYPTHIATPTPGPC